MDEADERRARDEQDAELELAIRKWLRARAALGVGGEYPSGDPILNGWVVVANYSTIELEVDGATAGAFGCMNGQPAPFSRGLAEFGTDHWS